MTDGNQMPDHKDPDCALPEIDCYAWIPAKFWQSGEIPNHRLSLRFRYSTGEFEVYRWRMRWQHKSKPSDDSEVILKSKNLKEVCTFINDEVRRFHGHEFEATPCKRTDEEHHNDCDRRPGIL